MQLEERLNEIIIEKESRIEELVDKIEKMEANYNMEKVNWQRHLAFENDEFYNQLPYPRLEMRLERVSEDNWYAIEWVYGLVYKHFVDANNDTLMFIPFSKTTSSGGNMTFENWYKNGELDLPYRDGVHIYVESLLFKLPAFIVCKEKGVFNKIQRQGDYREILTKMANY
jgi:hypothetical protein